MFVYIRQRRIIHLPECLKAVSWAGEVDTLAPRRALAPPIDLVGGEDELAARKDVFL